MVIQNALNRINKINQNKYISLKQFRIKKIKYSQNSGTNSGSAHSVNTQLNRSVLSLNLNVLIWFIFSEHICKF